MEKLSFERNKIKFPVVTAYDEKKNHTIVYNGIGFYLMAYV